jgi:hypothetical protein
MSQTNTAGSAPRNQTNGWGIAGFIVSLVGFVLSCGCLSPIGLVLSIIGLFREPRGFAIAGLILGILGSFWLILAVFLIPAIAIAIVGAALAAAGMAGLAAVFEMGIDGAQIYQAVERYRADTGQFPAQIEDLQIADEAVLTDPWDMPYRIELVLDADTGQEAPWLVSAGPDAVFGTDDDIQFMDLTTGDVREEVIEEVVQQHGGGDAEQPGEPAPPPPADETGG